MTAMALVYSRDGRVRETVVLPRFRVEEDLVEIQAAAGETSKWINRADSLLEAGNLTGVKGALGAADTLARLTEQTAHRLAGEVTACPSGLNGPDGHAA